LSKKTAETEQVELFTARKTAEMGTGRKILNSAELRVSLAAATAGNQSVAEAGSSEAARGARSRELGSSVAITQLDESASRRLTNWVCSA